MSAARSNVCANCMSPLVGEYCHSCGQHVIDGRITLRGLWRDMLERYLTLERGLVPTLAGMFTSPGSLVRSYLAGQRRRFMNPFAYLLLGAAISYFGFELFGGLDGLGLRESLEDLASTRSDLSASQKQRWVELTLGLTRYTSSIGLLMTVPLALLLALFQRRQINMAESVVLAVFLMGQVFWVDSISLVTLFLSRDPMFQQVLTMSIYIGVAFWVGWTFARPRQAKARWIGAAKAVGAMALSYVAMGLVFQIALEALVRASG